VQQQLSKSLDSYWTIISDQQTQNRLNRWPFFQIVVNRVPALDLCVGRWEKCGSQVRAYTNATGPAVKRLNLYAIQNLNEKYITYSRQHFLIVNPRGRPLRGQPRNRVHIHFRY